ncbi:VWA domain-containing protein [Halegenticoccus tardaugens]|uniref:VWA domain-containing protein n=1 Tax=Halegenticoccus tardaugens TaxID=2071624 RepID=UPI00100C234E|nr:VWA domain-containing protein [Halegenticoccus tardaugens]
MVDLRDGKNLSASSASEASRGHAGEQSDSAVPVSFGDIVGQEAFKRALLAVVADDGLSGLLVRGEKGTAKSTAVWGLVDLLPEQRAIADCPFGCPPDDPGGQCVDCRGRSDPPIESRPVPLVTLPLGATRDRVVGTLSVSDALAGEANFEPGLLARANRGILYVDEVNLLDDHLVDVLLDAAAGGVNRVERDGVSVAHPAAFTLVGTMNPEEGDLRPQLRDRFDLQASVTGCRDLDDRVAVIDRALGLDSAGADGEETRGTAEWRDRLLAARERRPDVTIAPEFRREIAELCRDAGVEGHRADIAAARAAMTLAALAGRTTVVESDLREAAAFALPHRLRSTPFDDAPDAESIVDDHFGEDGTGDGDDAGGDEGANAAEHEGSADGEGDDGEGDGRGDGSGGDEPGRDDGVDGRKDGTGGSDGPDGCGSDGGDGARDEGGGVDGDGGVGTGGEGETADRKESMADGEGERDDGREGSDDDAEPATPIVPGESRAGVGDGVAPVIARDASDRGDGSAASGRRVRASPSPSADGPRVRTERAEGSDSGAIDAAASVRAAAARGADRVGERDLRRSIREGTAEALVVFAVDASASMRPAMRAAKGIALDLLRDAYERRDAVSMVAFAGDDAAVVLPPTGSVDLAARHLKELPTGDRTPLAAGLRTAAEVLDRAAPTAGVVVLVTDGRANASDSPTAETRAAARTLAEREAHVVVVDAGNDGAGLVADVVERTGGERVPLSALSTERVDAAVDRARRGAEGDPRRAAVDESPSR